MQAEEFGQFQLEATKLGRNIVFQVTVFRRNDGRRERLFAETQCSDPYHFMIQFIIRDETTHEGIIERFKRQLLHRGYTPLRTRRRSGADRPWEAWAPVSFSEEDRKLLGSAQ